MRLLCHPGSFPYRFEHVGAERGTVLQRCVHAQLPRVRSRLVGPWVLLAMLLGCLVVIVLWAGVAALVACITVRIIAAVRAPWVAAVAGAGYWEIGKGNALGFCGGAAADRPRSEQISDVGTPTPRARHAAK